MSMYSGFLTGSNQTEIFIEGLPDSTGIRFPNQLPNNVPQKTVARPHSIIIFMNLFIVSSIGTKKYTTPQAIAISSP